MKIYANRYGMIESFELAFALQFEAERRRRAEEEAALRAVRRAARRQRCLEGLRLALRSAARFRESLRAASSLYLG